MYRAKDSQSEIQELLWIVISTQLLVDKHFGLKGIGEIGTVSDAQQRR